MRRLTAVSHDRSCALKPQPLHVPDGDDFARVIAVVCDDALNNLVAIRRPGRQGLSQFPVYGNSTLAGSLPLWLIPWVTNRWPAVLGPERLAIDGPVAQAK